MLIALEQQLALYTSHKYVTRIATDKTCRFTFNLILSFMLTFSGQSHKRGEIFKTTGLSTFLRITNCV